MLILCVILGILTVARITRLLVEDRIFIGYRQWAIRRFGEDSKMAYLVHCPWCTSMWVGLVMVPVVLFPHPITAALLAPLAASMVTGLLMDRKE